MRNRNSGCYLSTTPRDTFTHGPVSRRLETPPAHFPRLGFLLERMDAWVRRLSTWLASGTAHKLAHSCDQLRRGGLLRFGIDGGWILLPGRTSFTAQVH